MSDPLTYSHFKVVESPLVGGNPQNLSPNILVFKVVFHKANNLSFATFVRG